MHYTPHKLQKLVVSEPENDEYGRPIVQTFAEEWVDVCRCRCDHNGEKEVKTQDGVLVRPDFHIVAENNRPEVKVGDTLRCVLDNGDVWARGTAIRVKLLNVLPYAEIYI